ncbi:ABC transporter ATP-binding protein [Shumkonia mesophila]|uniref:ABC transporter ATP-binding protein n=1 Tax=Shumkonia mesophila TaxID=2838854 RepID=UPI00293420AF|nr:sn-glycerol-3-phosphate ABC transporter ATP-binding protein UgpC [Shumkonia mesophila]
MASIQMERIVKDYSTMRAIHGIDLEIPDGEFVAFVGPSGCGKSTLLRMVAGLEEISSGTLRIGNRVVNHIEPRDRDVAMVFQDYALYPHMTIAENIGFGLKMRGIKRHEIEKQVEKAADILQIGDLLDRKPGQLSGGQRQRVAMGRAIVRNPQVFLFDEPLSNLDAKLRVAMRTQIKRLHEMLRTTTIYVTHDQVEAMTLADRVVILRRGEIVQAGSPVEVYSSPNCQFVGEFIGSPQMNVLRARVHRQADRTTLEIADARIPVKQIDLPAGTEIHVGIRPEHLNWCSPEDAYLSPLLDVCEPLGSDTMAICLLGEQELTARLDPKLPLKRKEQIHLNFSTENLHVFDRESGRKVPFVG